MNTLRGILGSVRTVEKLIEAWPEVEPYCPANHTRAAQLVVRPEIINAMFGLPTPTK